MNARLLPATAAVMLGLGAAGCGGSSSYSATSSSTAVSTPTSSTAAPITHPRTTSQATKTRPKAHPAPARAPGPARTIATVAPSTPAGTSPPPDGLRPVSGYGDYDLCASDCSGAVPVALRRPLHLPHGSGTQCPTAGAGGPVYPVGGSALTLTPFLGSQWSAARVQWASTPGYTGPVLLRGRALDGSGAVGFGEGHVPDDELQLLAGGMDAPPAPGGGRSWLTFTRVRGPGCYAYQVDGTSFSSVTVFRAN